MTCYTRWPRYVDLNSDAWYPEPVLVSAPFCTMSEPESMSESHLSVTFITAGIVWSCQSTLFRAMLIIARIARDQARATLVRATLSETILECTLKAGIVRDYVRATLVRATSVSLGLLDQIRAAFVTVKWGWIPGCVAVPVSWERYISKM